MKEMQLTSWVCTALMRVGTRLATTFDQHFAELGITQAQFRVLLAVWETGGDGGIAPSELAETLFIERATVSVLTDRMVQNGWLAREPGENRRTYNLVLTRAGGQLLGETAPQADQLADETLANISRDELQVLRDSLDVIESRLRSTAGMNPTNDENDEEEGDPQ